MDSQYPYEKLGLFYLGRELDINSGVSTQRPLLYKNKSMTTHGVVIGIRSQVVLLISEKRPI